MSGKAGRVIFQKSVGMLPYLSLISTEPLSFQNVAAANQPKPKPNTGAGIKVEILMSTLQIANVAKATITA